MTDEKKSTLPDDYDPEHYDPKTAKQPMPEDYDFETGTTEDDNILRQNNPEKWMRRPPRIMRGDPRMAMKCAAEADKYKCTCWNVKCPFHGDCRKCIVLHMHGKQLPTCQRDMVIELYKEGTLAEELYIDEETDGAE